ncbi:MAG TPA: thiamine pyrophosphate-dependent enzyme [Polyangia bacterium]|jgi:indolepyruvate ferredoxin oxidoreductase alpha subunit
MTVEILLGDEAVALGALHAGLSGAYAYPGTPATEIHEYIQRTGPQFGLGASPWSTNEKVAYEEALGCSHTSKRALVCMKHVGLNVAADPFMNSAVTGVDGGLVIAVADDPGMHSSQDEQDSRYFAQFAQIPCFEPSTQQQAYDMTRAAYDLSERLRVPVMIRLVTRMAHSRAAVKVGAPRPQNPLAVSRARDTWTLLPTNARAGYRKLMEKQAEMLADSEASRFNRLSLEGDRRLGVIASGVAVNYVLENVETPLPLLELRQYPLPEGLIRTFVAGVDRVLVVEEGYPFIERQLRGVLGNEKIRGKLDGALPITGELLPSIVRAALGLPPRGGEPVRASIPLPARPPALCQGCSHIDAFNALNAALDTIEDKGAVYGDIGCYTLGFYPPYDGIDACVCMGASVSMAKGAADAGAHPVVAVIGDSTFAHSGITPLLSAAQCNSPMTVVILDNSTTAMTGGQHSMATGGRLEEICAGVGVAREHIRVITPLRKHHDENVKVFQDEIAYRGLSVVIPRRECIHTARR